MDSSAVASKPKWVTHNMMEETLRASVAEKQRQRALERQKAVNDWWSSTALPDLVDRRCFVLQSGKWKTTVPFGPITELERSEWMALILAKVTTAGAPYSIEFESDDEDEDEALDVTFTAL